MIPHEVDAVADDRGGVEHRRNADGDDGHAEDVLRQAAAFVADAGSRVDARVRDLDRRVDPLQRLRREGVDRDDHVGLRAVDDALHDIARFDARDAEHARRDRAHVPVAGSDFVWHQLEKMPGHERVLHDDRSERIRGHVPIAEADDQYVRRLADIDPLEKSREFLRQLGRDAILKAGILLAQLGHLEGDVMAHHFPHGARAFLGRHVQTGDLDAVFVRDVGQDAGNRPVSGGLRHFLRFQRQVDSDVKSFQVQVCHVIRALLPWSNGFSVRKPDLNYAVERRRACGYGAGNAIAF